MEVAPYGKTGVFQNFYENRQKIENDVKYEPIKNFEPSFSNNSENNNKKKVALAAFLGATAPVAALNLIKGGKNLNGLKNSSLKEKIKAGLSLFEVNKYSKLMASITGAALFGTCAGYFLEDNQKNKKAKVREGVFEFLNAAIPTTLVAAGEKILSEKEADIIKTKGQNAPSYIRGAIVLSSVAGGMAIANKTSNKLNEKVFDKNEEKPHKRNFKMSDCLVHLDDLIGLCVLTKSPLLNSFAEKCQMDKILPFLYAKCGYEAGTKEDK